MYTTREFIRVSAFSLAAMLGLLTRPVSGQTLDADEVAALLDKEDMTKEDHLKLADYYASEAKQLRKAAARHDSMAERYRPGRRLPPKVAAAFRSMPMHCENLAQSLRNAAKASEELAKVHRDMADEAK